MNRTRLLNILSLLFNLAIVGFVTYVLVAIMISNILAYIIYFTVLSNLFAGLAALVMIPFNIVGIINGQNVPKFSWVLKYIAAICVTITMVTAMTFLASQDNWDVLKQIGNFQFDNIYFQFHFLTPILTIVSFLLFDHVSKERRPRFGVTFFPLLAVVAYSAYYMTQYFLAGQNPANDWYGFITNGIGWGAFGLAILLVSTFIVAILYWLINNSLSSVFYKTKSTPLFDEAPEGKEDENAFVAPEQEPSKEEEPVEETKEEPAEEKAPVVEKTEKKVAEKKKPAEKKETKPEEKKEPEKKATEKKPAQKKKPAETKEAEKKPAEKKSAEKNTNTKVYHLTKRKEDGMWAITFVGGKKPVKLFKTKKEAEAALEVLTKNQGATALIRNSKGSKAGKFASSIKKPEGE